MPEETEQLLLLEYQAAWENYRHLFALRLDLLKYLFTAAFATIGATPVVLGYLQARQIPIRTNYYVLLLVIVAIWLLALLALLTYGVLVNWNRALEKHYQAAQNIRQLVFGPDSAELRAVAVSFPFNPVADKWLRPLHQSPAATELVSVLFLALLLVADWTAAALVIANTAESPAIRWAPLLLPASLTVVSAGALLRRLTLWRQFKKQQTSQRDSKRV